MDSEGESLERPAKASFLENLHWIFNKYLYLDICDTLIGDYMDLCLKTVYKESWENRLKKNTLGYT